MKLYHGTNTNIEHIDFTISKVTIDEFFENLKYKHIVLQYFFGTQNAIKHLRKL